MNYFTSRGLTLSFPLRQYAFDNRYDRRSDTMVAEPPPQPRMLLGLMVVGSEMAGFTILGILVDFAVGTLPWVTVGLTVFGFAFVFYQLTRMAKAMSRGGKSP